MDEEKLKKLQEKADAYDVIVDKINWFYSDENIDNENIDLCTIGEWICSHFKYI